MSPLNRSRAFWAIGLACICNISAAAYLIFSDFVRFDLKSISYIDFLLTNFPAGHEPLYLLLFVPSCVLTGVLMARQFRVWSPPGPVCCLFAIAAAIVPPQIMALALWPEGRGEIRSDRLLVLSLGINLCLASAVLLRKRRGSRIRDEEGHNPRWGWGGVYLSLTAFVAVLVFIYATGNLVGADALTYHLPLAASWLKTGSITTGPDIQYHFTANMSLLLRWALAGSSDLSVFLIPFICSVLFVCVLYGVAKAAGHSREVAAICACSAAMCPPFVHLSTTAYSESFGCLCLALAVYFLVRWDRAAAPPWPFVVCIGLAAGMAAGTKCSMLPTCLVILACTIGLVWTRFKSVPTRVAALGLLTATLIAGGGYWYLRGLVQFGNPFYPVAFLGLPGTPLQSILASDVLRPGLKSAVYPWTEVHYSNPYDQGVGAVFAVLCIPAIVLFPLVIRKWREDGSPAPLAAKLIYSVVLGSFAVHVLLGDLTPRHILAPLLLSSVLIGFLWRSAQSAYFRVAAFLPFATMALLLGVSFFSGCLYRSNLAHQQGAERFGLPKVVDEIKAAKILNAGWQFFHYGLMGRDHRHEVITLFRDATPEDALKHQVEYVFVRESQLPRFQAKLNMALLADVKQGQGERLSFWRVQSRTVDRND